MTNTEIANANKIMLGSTEAIKMYIGSTLLWEPQNSLPYDAELQYLESVGGQKITLNFNSITNAMLANNKLEYVTNLQLTSTESGAEGVNGLYYFVGVNDNKYYSGCGLYWQKSGTSPDLNDHELKLIVENNTVTYYLDNNVIDSYSFGQGFSNNLNKFGLFYCINYSGAALCKQRKSYAKLTLGTQVIFECIPVRVGQVGYMYDKVSGQLYGNEGTGDFILGRDKLPAGYTELEYISSTSSGGQYIDLDILLYDVLNKNYDIAIKFKAKGSGQDNTTQGTIFGCQDNTGSPWPGTFIRIAGNGTDMQGRYIGGSGKDNTLGRVNNIIELTEKTSPNKNVYNYNNSGRTHTWGTSLFCIFNSQNKINRIRYIEADLYYFKLFVEGTLVRDMIPCKNSNDVAGLYDLVNNVFYASPNGALFVAGPTV